MIPVTSFSGKLVAVFGLGMSGLGTAKALEAGGAFVACWDDNEDCRKKASLEDLTLANLEVEKWTGIDALVLSPGVPLTHPEPHWVVKKAQEAGVEIIGDTELFFREHRSRNAKSKIIGITGTNGKSTTTALVAHLLKSAGCDVQMGGNIGKAVLDLESFKDDRVYVIEYSSYQIDLTPSMKLDAAALLNITPDHIDRHGTVENYAAVKQRIFQNMVKGQVAVIGVDDQYCRDISEQLQGDFKKLEVSVVSEVAKGIYAKDGQIFDVSGDETQMPISVNGIASLRGTHNWQNAAFATALVKSVGLSDEEIQAGLESFPGLEHRMQEIARDGSVIFVNDSKATNADAAEKALSSFDEIYWIVGGVAKDGGIDNLKEYFPKIAKAYLIGESSEEFAKVLGDKVRHEICGTIQHAVAAAHVDAKQSNSPEQVVLLSPACASFDQYPNFMLRGKAFCDAVLGE